MQFKQMMNKLDPFDADEEPSDHEITTTTIAAVPNEMVVDENKDPKVIQTFLLLIVLPYLCNSHKTVHLKRSELHQLVVLAVVDIGKPNVQSQESRDWYPPQKQLI